MTKCTQNHQKYATNQETKTIFLNYKEPYFYPGNNKSWTLKDLNHVLMAATIIIAGSIFTRTKQRLSEIKMSVFSPSSQRG